VGALALVGALGQSMNIYTQIGLITLVGLITKHGILIVEFANQKMEQGHGAFEAAYQAACLRLRPILMTSAAMIVGSLPLLFSKDAGSEARQVLGAVLVGGLSLGTLFTLFAIPVFYHFMKKHLGKAS
jgi:multidrug efflux pump